MDRRPAGRPGRSFDELTEEWTARGPQFDVALEHVTGPRSVMAAVDVWSHQQDVLGAIGRRGERGDERQAFLVDASVQAFDGRFCEAGVALELVVDGERRIVGAGAPTATWTIDGYELVRTLTGRRSAAQITAAGWDGDAAPFLDHVHLFDLPAADLTD